MSHRAVLLAQLKLARAQKIARAAELTCVLKLAAEKVAIPWAQMAQGAGKMLSRGSAAVQGAVGRQAPQAVRSAQQLAGKANAARAQATNAARNAVGSRVLAGSPEHQALLARGAQFKSHGLTPTRGGKAIPKSTANLQAAQQNASPAQQPKAMAMLMKQRATRARIPQAPGLPQDQSHGLLLADANARNLRGQAVQAARGAAPLQAAHRAGQAAKPLVGAAAGHTAAGAGASAADSAGLGREVTAGSLREKIAARIINADVGLDAIIAHIKSAKVKRAAAAMVPGQPAAVPGAKPAPKPAPKPDFAGLPKGMASLTSLTPGQRAGGIGADVTQLGR